MEKPNNEAQRYILENGVMAAPGGCILQLPTGTGKTWLSLQEIRRTLELGQRAIYVTPLRAQAEELVSKWVTELAPYKIGIFTGDYGQPGKQFPTSFEEAQLLVMTPERLDACTRFWRSHWHWIPAVDLLVIDELHIIGSPRRGPKLECAISRFRRLNPLARLVGLSATLGNRAELADWMGGTEYSSKDRPIPLYWHRVTFKKADQKLEALLNFLNETGEALGQALVFVHSRRRAQQVAEALTGSGYSAAHHHAGLTQETRRRVEQQFRLGDTRILVCTPTLEMGVNLPARYVFLYDLQRFDGDRFVPLTVNQAWQRGGRAGRPGLDDEGHVVLLTPSWDRNRNRYENSKFDPVRSQLEDPKSLTEQIVAEVGSGFSRTRKQLSRALKTSLAAHQGRLDDVHSILDEMIASGMIVDKQTESGSARTLTLKATPLGRVAVRHLLSPSTISTFKRVLTQPLSLSYFDLLLTVSSCEDQEPQIRANFEDLEQINEHCRQLPSALLHSPELESILETPGKRLLTAINTARVLYFWAQFGDLERVAALTGCFATEVGQLRDSSDRLLGALFNVYRVINPKEQEDDDQLPSNVLTPAEKISALRFMIRSGLPASAASLAAISGLGPTLAKRLYVAGYEDTDDLAAADPRDVCEIQGISLQRAQKWIVLAEQLIKTRPTYLFKEEAGQLITSAARGNKTDHYRARRARSLSVQVISAKEFRVTGGTDPHIVEELNGQLQCDCEDFRKGNRCKHLIAIDLVRSEQRSRARIQSEKSSRSGALDLYTLWDTPARDSVNEPRVAA